MSALSAIDAAIWTLGDHGCTTDELRAAREAFVSLLAIAEDYAGTCCECGGTGTPEFGEHAGKPCPDCADILAVIAQAQTEVQPLTKAQEAEQANVRS